VARLAAGDGFAQQGRIDRRFGLFQADHEQIGPHIDGLQLAGRACGQCGSNDFQAQGGMREQLRKSGSQQRMILQQDCFHGFLVFL
jgi:hypothetical protein